MGKKKETTTTVLTFVSDNRAIICVYYVLLPLPLHPSLTLTNTSTGQCSLPCRVN